MGRDAHQGKAIKVLRALSLATLHQVRKKIGLATFRDGTICISAPFNNSIRAD